MAKTVDVTGFTSDEDLLHFDRHRMKPVVEAAWAAMKAEAIRQNPDDDEAMHRMLCGGCLTSFLMLMHDKMLDEGEADDDTRETHHKAMMRHHRERIEGPSFETLLARFMRSNDR
jgi:hypothetical protein